MNTSDREVNLKILLRGPVEDGQLSLAERDALLAACSADVVAAVLADNRRQTMAISIAEGYGATVLDRYDRAMHNLEQAAGMDRVLEHLPSAADIAARRGAEAGLSRPEIAVLLSHAKNLVHCELMDSDLPGDPALLGVLRDDLPAPVRDRFADRITTHPLAAEIVATRVASNLIDRIGPGFLYRPEDRTGAASPSQRRAVL